MSDAELSVLAKASYDPTPEGRIIDWRDCRMVVTDNVVAIRGTVPDIPQNLLRDLQIALERSHEHPILGPCGSGALDAAEGLTPLLPPEVDTVVGHSLGGQIGVVVAALLLLSSRPIRLLVTFDAPKAGGNALVSALSVLPIRQYRHRGSPVTDWPLLFDRHVREPLITIDPWVLGPIRAHSIDRTVEWLQANRDGVPVTVVLPTDIGRVVIRKDPNDGKLTVGFITAADATTVWVRYADFAEGEPTPRANLAWNRRDAIRSGMPLPFRPPPK